MPKSKSRKKKTPKRVLALPDLEQTKTAVLNSLTSASGQRTTTTRFASSSRGNVRSPALRSTARSCSGTGFISNSASMRLPRSTFGLPRFGAWRTRLPRPAC
jgi:hypothetical protein